MPEEVSYDADAQLIRICVRGDDPIEDWLSSKKEVIRLHELHGSSSLLVDVREQGAAPSVLDIFDFAEDWPHQIHAAILVSEKTTEDIAFLETVAMNRGKHIRLFDDESEALDWLGV